MTYEVVAKGQIMLIRLEGDISREDLDSFLKIVEQIKKSEAQIFVFDLSSLIYLDIVCIRPFISAQDHIRKKDDSLVIVIKPEWVLESILLAQGAVRSHEVCPSIHDIPNFFQAQTSLDLKKWLDDES